MATTDIDKALADATKLAEDKKAKMDKEKEALDNATSKYTAAKELRDKYQARVENAEAVSEISNSLTNSVDMSLKPLQNGIAALKKGILNLRWQAEDALELLKAAKSASDKLEAKIAKLTENGEPVSGDLVADSPKVNTSISKAWDDAVTAYSSTMEAVEMVTAAEQSLVAINNQLQYINTSDAPNLKTIRENFKILGPSVADVKSLEEAKDDTDKFDKASKEYNLAQAKVDKLNAEKTVRDAINA